MKKEIIKKVEEARQRFSEIYGVDIKMLPIRFTLKGRVAGRITYNRHYNFNLHIAENNKGFLERTVPHEVAHQVALQIYGLHRGKGHGVVWKNVMRKFGLKPSRCHSYENVISARKMKQYDYECSCGKHYTISSVRYNRDRRGYREYLCTACRTIINMSNATLQGGER